MIFLSKKWEMRLFSSAGLCVLGFFPLVTAYARSLPFVSGCPVLGGAVSPRFPPNFDGEGVLGRGGSGLGAGRFGFFSLTAFLAPYRQIYDPQHGL